MRRFISVVVSAGLLASFPISAPVTHAQQPWIRLPGEAARRTLPYYDDLVSKLFSRVAPHTDTLAQGGWIDDVVLLGGCGTYTVRADVLVDSDGFILDGRLNPGGEEDVSLLEAALTHWDRLIAELQGQPAAAEYRALDSRKRMLDLMVRTQGGEASWQQRAEAAAIRLYEARGDYQACRATLSALRRVT
jgi:hypothetical protein